MADVEDLFQHMPARLLYPDRAVEHQVPALGGRPPTEFDLPAGAGRYERFRLLGWDCDVVEYELVDEPGKDDGGAP
ncbi:hypothetical protein ACPPVW_18400 [Leifsonia sp. McL0607]|uniref:hypothetical protein n=1 Tax=Leifsonia sp. McL0607 TaxID=3415672 RepID=UPI003CF1DDF7